MTRLKNKLVFGWGINDVDYEVTRTEVVNGKSKIVWICPYYLDWQSLLRRCFDPKFQKRRPTYIGCTICEGWKYFSNFIKWVDSQPNKDWMDCEPDKDLLVEGNKHYSPETVIYIPRKINCFITDRKNDRGDYMLGVTYDRNSKSNGYVSRCSDIFSGESIYLGRFSTELSAHKAWQAKKHEIACRLSELQSDPRLITALRERYAPNKDWTNK